MKVLIMILLLMLLGPLTDLMLGALEIEEVGDVPLDNLVED
jgi:hypothetical protein